MASFSFGTGGERRKSTKRTRFGGRAGPPTKTEGRAFEVRITRELMTPHELAVGQLTKELLHYTQYIEGASGRYALGRQRFGEMDQLRFMNMKYLAMAIVLLETSPRKEPTPETFTGPVWDEIQRRLSTTPELSTPEAIIKHKEQLLTYMATIILWDASTARLPAESTFIDTPLKPEETEVVADPVEPDVPLPPEEASF